MEHNYVIKAQIINAKRENALIILLQQLIKIVIRSYLVVELRVLDVFHQQRLAHHMKEL
jgi:hypothetical protein